VQKGAASGQSTCAKTEIDVQWKNNIASNVLFKALVWYVNIKTTNAYNKLLLLPLKVQQCNNFFAYYKPKLQKKQHSMSAVHVIQSNTINRFSRL
jgi:late competence protein required for DNA uptake (superfamily II DNA/RNA helicase)